MCRLMVWVIIWFLVTTIETRICPFTCADIRQILFRRMLD